MRSRIFGGRWRFFSRSLAVSVVFFAAPARAAAPDTPVLAGPGDAATGVSTSPTLEVTVSDTDGDAMDVTFYGRRAGEPLPGDDFTVIAMPDTQHYTDVPANEANFAAQTQWIVDNKDALNIAFVTGLGDIVAERRQHHSRVGDRRRCLPPDRGSRGDGAIRRYPVWTGGRQPRSD